MNRYICQIENMKDYVAKHTGIICGTQVSSRARYVVFGRVRGLVAECSSFEAARRALVRDQLGCQKQGGYSDAAIYEWGVGGWAGAHVDVAERS